MTMEEGPAEIPKAHETERVPWLALIIIVLAKLQMAISVFALPASLGPISKDLNAPATALLLYSLCVAAFVMPGAKKEDR